MGPFFSKVKNLTNHKVHSSGNYISSKMVAPDTVLTDDSGTTLTTDSLEILTT